MYVIFWFLEVLKIWRKIFSVHWWSLQHWSRTRQGWALSQRLPLVRIKSLHFIVNIMWSTLAFCNLVITLKWPINFYLLDDFPRVIFLSQANSTVWVGRCLLCTGESDENDMVCGGFYHQVTSLKCKDVPINEWCHHQWICLQLFTFHHITKSMRLTKSGHRVFHDSDLLWYESPRQTVVLADQVMNTTEFYLFV